MLKQRLLTAGLLIPFVVAGVLWLPLIWLAVLFGGIALLGAWEWSGLCGSRRAQAVYTLFLSIVLAVCYLLETRQLMYLLAAAVIWWGVALFWVVRYQQGENLLPKRAVWKNLSGFLILLTAWAALVMMRRDYSAEWVLFFLCLIWAADSGAYFAGRRWGKRKLAARVSPGKTWVGVGGAVAAAIAVTIPYLYWLKATLPQAVLLLSLVLTAVLISIVGDLLESLFKRQADCKDSGTLLPGHGGVLDRIDSLVAAAPFFVLGLKFILDNNAL